MSWSKKYKKSIDCSNAKGFSQKAHCDGRKARQRGEKTKSKSLSELKMKKTKIKEELKQSIDNKISRSQLEQMIREEVQKHLKKKLNLEQILLEGVDDPGILKCVFMAGGPGSGKSFTAMEIFGVDKKLNISFSATGLKMVNSDKAFEAGLKKNGIDSKKLAQIEKEDPELWDKIAGSGGHSIRSKSKAITAKQKSFYESGRLGMVIDGTGHDYSKIKKQKEKAEALGYDCYMIFVNTSLEVARERNENRDRVLPEKILVQSWKDVQNNLGKFQGLFGGNFVIVDNTVYKPIDKEIQKQVNRFIRNPIYNRIGKKWIETARALKKAKLIKENSSPKQKIKMFFEENVPTDPQKWSYYKSQAKKKFDVYPCVPLDSLAVTKHGLKSYDELIIGEDILSYNMEKEELEWTPIKNLHYYENADLMEIKKSTGFRFRCTPNHKWVIKREEDRNPELIESKDITTHMKMVFSSNMNEVITKSNLLNENWGKHDTWVEKIIQMTPSEREIWLSSAIVYDGWEKGKSTKIEGRRTFGFSQKNRDHLLATIYAAYLNGYYVSVNDFDKNVVGVTIIRGKQTHSTQNVIKTFLDEKEDVWCPETKNQTWVMVQNGWFTITGNSAYANGWAAKKYKAAGGGWRKKK